MRALDDSCHFFKRKSKTEKVGKDMAFSIRLLERTTLALDKRISKDIQEFPPDCIVADSMAADAILQVIK